MSQEINRVPEGLLSLLDMKTRGAAPRFLSSEVQGGIDLWSLYTAPRRENIVDTAVVNAVGNFPFFLTAVPQTEIWYVWSVSLVPTAVLVGGAGLIRFQIGCIVQPNNRFQFYGDPLPYQAQAGDLPIVSYNTPFIMLGGDYLSVAAPEYVAFAPDPTIGIEVMLTRIPI